MKVRVLYYAALREQTAKAEESLEVDCPNIRDLYKLIQSKYQLTLEENQLKVAVNDQFTSFDQELNEQDKVVFIPPVAGG